MSVTLRDVVLAVRCGDAALVGESAGYLVLGASDLALDVPRKIGLDSLSLHSEGKLVLDSSPCTLAEAETGLRVLLGQLLSLVRTPCPNLDRVARRSQLLGLPGLVRELEAALVPVNRKAARRSLARLLRETSRSMQRGRTAMSIEEAPRASSFESLSLGPPPELSVEAPVADVQPAAQAVEIVSRVTPEAPASVPSPVPVPAEAAQPVASQPIASRLAAASQPDAPQQVASQHEAAPQPVASQREAGSRSTAAVDVPERAPAPHQTSWTPPTPVPLADPRNVASHGPRELSGPRSGRGFRVSQSALAAADAAARQTAAQADYDEPVVFDASSDDLAYEEEHTDNTPTEVYAPVAPVEAPVDSATADTAPVHTRSVRRSIRSWEAWTRESPLAWGDSLHGETSATSLARRQRSVPDDVSLVPCAAARLERRPTRVTELLDRMRLEDRADDELYSRLKHLSQVELSPVAPPVGCAWMKS